MNAVAEYCLQETVLPELERHGRPDYDRPHTELVVEHMKGILARHAEELDLDGEVLTIAAYAHDWGYTALTSGIVNWLPLNHGLAMAYMKPLHMLRGKDKILGLMERRDEFSYLTAERRQRVGELVASHDKVKDLVAVDEIVLMEADTLGFMDPRSPSTYDSEKRQEVHDHAQELRVPRFRTDYAKETVSEWLERPDGLVIPG